ncbi:MAG TPA: DJ-1/PfpI family protein [Stellaceae bacterium]|nr:DJ-1/PfpI family protein [Stellaceae bacterium]
MTAAPFRIGFLLFPRLTQLDLTGPYEILSRMPGAETHLIAKSLEPVRSERGLQLLPTTTLALCPPLDLLCVPGGAGVNEVMTDGEMLSFIRRAAADARYVTSVCTGSLALGAAGLLRGRRAACHWMSREALKAFGAEPVAERVVVDGRFITGGGVTAGIDFALAVVDEICGREAAETIQLVVEYDPEPPFAAGSTARASAAVVARVRALAEPMLQERAAAVRRAAAALSGG